MLPDRAEFRVGHKGEYTKDFLKKYKDYKLNLLLRRIKVCGASD